MIMIIVKKKLHLTDSLINGINTIGQHFLKPCHKDNWMVRI